MADTITKKVDGLRAVELNYRVIRDISSGQAAFLHSRTHLNAPKLGILTPEQFRDVAEITNQCVELFWLEFQQAIDAAITFEEREVIFQWLTVYMPVRVLLQVGIERALVERCTNMNLPTNRICFELSEHLLEETDGLAAESIRLLRNRGFHFMLSDFGGNSCPMMRLADFPVDYVMLSPEVSYYIGRGKRSDEAVRSIIGFITDLEAIPIADGVENSHQAEVLHEFDCRYCAGSLAGKYLQERYIRKKKSDEDEE